MSRWGIALDMGTSGFRAQAIDISSGRIVSTVITTHHFLPGANVIDHIHFALEMGLEAVQSRMVGAVNRVIQELGISLCDVEQFAVCGNPVQLSLFQGMEIRDLAYPGTEKQKSLGLRAPARNAAIIKAASVPGLNLPGQCEVIIPPAIQHEVGADALAMIIQSGMLDKNETSIVIDFGTNAELSLFHNGKVFTGSTAAGSALEGQQLTCGMIAIPGVVSDLKPAGAYHRQIVLNSEMFAVGGDLVCLSDNSIIEQSDGPRPAGITGTGVVAMIAAGMQNKLIVLPHIKTADKKLHCGEHLFLTEADVIEAGKAIGAIRAGYMTLCRQAGISLEEISTIYMAGAFGTYVDANKAQKLGLVPPGVKHIYQLGNTSLAMARELVLNPEKIQVMGELAETFRNTHCMFATSNVFKQIFILEFSYWTEGMPMLYYRELLKKYGLAELFSAGVTSSTVVKVVKRAIDDLGEMGLRIITDIGRAVCLEMAGCTGCRLCIKDCPGRALSLDQTALPPRIALDESMCNGIQCRRCERICPAGVFDLNRFFQQSAVSSSTRNKGII